MSPMLAEGTGSISFDANPVPTGLLDTIPMEKTVLDSFDKPLINSIQEHKESSSVAVLV